MQRIHIIGGAITLGLLAGSGHAAQEQRDADDASRSNLFSKAVDNALQPEVMDHVATLMGDLTRLEAFSLMAYPSSHFNLDENGNFNTNANTQAFAQAVLNMTQDTLRRANALAPQSEPREVFITILASSGSFVRRLGAFDKTAFNAALKNVDAGKVQKAAALMQTEQVNTVGLLLLTSGWFVDKQGNFNAQQFNSRFAGITEKQVTGTKEDRIRNFCKLMKQ